MTNMSLGMTSTVGSYVFAGSKPEKNASVVDQASMNWVRIVVTFIDGWEQLIEKGLIILGKTNLTVHLFVFFR